MLPSDCGTPKTFTGVPLTRCEAVLLKPVELLRSCGLMLTMLFVLSTWKTSVAEPEAPVAFTVTAFVPLGTLMPKLPELPFETQELATVPRGKAFTPRLHSTYRAAEVRRAVGGGDEVGNCAATGVEQRGEGEVPPLE